VQKTRSFPWLRVVNHIIGWLPLVLIGIAYANNALTVNPIQDIEQRLGRISLYFLMATLAVTPLYTLTGWRVILTRRKALGLYTFLYICLHVLTFLGLDYGFNIMLILPLLEKKPYIIVGLVAFFMLLPLAITSFDFFIRRMKRNWKRLHWLIYPAGLVVVLHYALSLKGNIFTLRGNELLPLLWAGVTLLLLALRLPPIRRWVSATRRKVVDLF